MGATWVIRERELDAVRDVLDRAESEPAGLAIEGEPGIGKTSLWLQAAEIAAGRGFAVLSARGTPTEIRYAHAAIGDLLSEVDTAVWADLPDVQHDALARILLGDSQKTITDERLVPVAFLAVLRRLEARSPVLLAIDDAQWLDSSSRSALAFATRRLGGRVAVLATIRTGDPSSETGHAWLTLPQPDALTRIRMRPLTLGGVHALVVNRLGRALPRPAMTRIYEFTGGNAFFALELARSVADDPRHALAELPASLAALVQSRIGTLPADADAVALAAASTVNPTVDLISRATSTATERVVEILEELETRGIVDIDVHRVRFAHPLYATGVYGKADTVARQAMHRSLAAIIDQPELKARHLALATTTADSATVEALDTAAQITRAQGAPAAAAELLELAIALGADSAPRLLTAAEHHFRAGSFTQALVRLDAVLDKVSSGALRIIALMLYAAVESYNDHYSGALTTLTSAVDQAEDPTLRLRALLLLTPVTGATGDLAGSLARAREAVSLAGEVGDPALRSQALSMWVMTSFICGRGADDEALRAALAEEAPETSPATYGAGNVAAVIAAWTGDLAQACSTMAQVRRRLLEQGTEVDILWAGEHATTFHVWSGRLDEAARIAADTTERAEQMGSRYVLMTALSAKAMVAAYAGDVDAARVAARTAVDIADAHECRYLAVAPTTTLAFVESSVGDYPAVLEAVKPILAERDPSLGTEIMLAGYLPDVIEALCAVGRVDEAEPYVVELETNGARMDRPWMLATGARCRALCLAARGDVPAAQRSIEVALAEHDRLPMPFEKARTQLVAGVLLRRRRQKQSAHAVISAAVTAFASLGAAVWERRARAELEALEARAVDRAELTAAERRIADLAASGLSNKEIAEQTFVAEKTVEANLSRVYRKLGIRSRATLGAALKAGTSRENPVS